MLRVWVCHRHHIEADLAASQMGCQMPGDRGLKALAAGILDPGSSRQRRITSPGVLRSRRFAGIRSSIETQGQVTHPRAAQPTAEA